MNIRKNYFVIGLLCGIAVALLTMGCSAGLLGSIDTLREKAKGKEAPAVDLGKMDIITAMYQDDFGVYSVIAMKPDGTGRKLLFKGAEGQYLYQPSIGPDGKTLILATWNDIDNGEIYTCDLTVGTPTIYSFNGGFYEYPIFSPDMSTLYACSNSPSSFIAINIATGNKVIRNVEKGISSFSFTSDGKIIYLTMWGNIEIMDVNGNYIQTLKDSEYYARPQTIPSLEQILYLKGYEGGESCVCVMNNYGGDEKELMTPSNNAFGSPSANSTGTQIAYSIGFEENPTKILVANFNGSSLSGTTIIQDTSVNGLLIKEPRFSKIDVAVYNNLPPFSPPVKNIDWYIISSGPNYTISTPEQLAGLAAIVNFGINDFSGKTITLGANIDMSSVEKWIPIGGYPYGEFRSFSGTLDGNGKIISNLSNGNTSGIFGINGGTVKNLTLTGLNINSGGEIGGIVGWNMGTVENCSVAGAISGSGTIGGVVGLNRNGTIQNCYVTCDVSGIESIGGIVGYNECGTVKNCYSTGNVSGNKNIGGVAGYCYEGTVENCYSTGNISGKENVGGVAGGSYIPAGSAIQNCVAINKSITAMLEADTTSFGRVVGYRFGSGTYANNRARADMVCDGFTPSVTTATGKDGADVSAGTGSTQYNSQAWWSATSPTGPGFAFGNTESAPWKMSGGLPVLYWE